MSLVWTISSRASSSWRRTTASGRSAPLRSRRSVAGMDDSTGASSPRPPRRIGLGRIGAGIEAEPYHWPVGRIRFQKIAYFATLRGIPTGLDFGRGSYGPFSPGLKQVTAKLVNNGVLVEDPGTKMIAVRPGRT